MADPVELDVKVPNDALVPVAPLQLLVVMPEAPVQNVKDSSTVAVTVIWLVVLTATVPESTAVVQAESE